ncbi:hypothetical protein OM341_22855 [Escherichia albertii]|nr:hypothetical protein [Escherichia albertii]
MKRIINFGLLLILNVPQTGISAELIRWDHSASLATNELTATVTGYNYTTNKKINETSRETYINVGSMTVPAIVFHTTYKASANRLQNIWYAGSCVYNLTDGSTENEDDVGDFGKRLTAFVSGQLTYLYLRDRHVWRRYPFLTARCKAVINSEYRGGDRLEYEMYIRNTGYKPSELVVTPEYFSIVANSDGNWKSGMVNVRVTNLSYVNITVTGGDVILVGQSERGIRAGESVEIYSIPDKYKDGYDTESTGKFYLRGNVRKFGKKTYTLTITHNLV